MANTKQQPPAPIVAEYEKLKRIMLESVYSVDFPFGVVAPTRKRMDAIEARYSVKELS